MSLSVLLNDLADDRAHFSFVPEPDAGQRTGIFLVTLVSSPRDSHLPLTARFVQHAYANLERAVDAVAVWAIEGFLSIGPLDGLGLDGNELSVRAAARLLDDQYGCLPEDAYRLIESMPDTPALEASAALKAALEGIRHSLPMEGVVALADGLMSANGDPAETEISATIGEIVIEA
jgi:hypothetical protein